MKFKALILPYCIFFLTSCNTKTNETPNNNSGMELPSEIVNEPRTTLEHIPSKEKQPPTTNNQPPTSYNYEKDFEAIVIGDGVRFRDAPNRGGKISHTADLGDLVHIIETSEDRETISDEPLCDSYGYHWYKTTDTQGREGWVYGKFLYARPTQGQFNSTQTENLISRFSDNEYYFNGVPYRFDFLVDQTIGASDEDGLTGCDQYAFPVFYKKGDPKIHFIKYMELENEAVRLHSSRGFLQFLWSSEGGQDELTAIAKNEDEGADRMELKITHYYQDGHSVSTIVISEKNGVFQLLSGINSGFQG